LVLIFWSFCIKAKGHITDDTGNKLHKEILNDSIILTGPFTENQYQARFITTDGQPTSLDSTLLIAQDSIVFKPDFHTQAGMRLTAKIDSTIAPVDQTDYIGGIEYRNLPRGMASSPAQSADSTGRGGIQAIYHPQGRAVPDGSTCVFAGGYDEQCWRHEYVITDHLGNTRLRFSDLRVMNPATTSGGTRSRPVGVFTGGRPAKNIGLSGKPGGKRYTFSHSPQ